MKQIIKAILTSAALFFTIGTVDATAQTYEETLNFIFNGNKSWSSVSYGTLSVFSNKLANYNEANCTVNLTIGIGCPTCNVLTTSTPLNRNGLLHLNGITGWEWKPVHESAFEYGLLYLESDGVIFEGEFYSDDGTPYHRCVNPA
jgi:hypothetical protein